MEKSCSLKIPVFNGFGASTTYEEGYLLGFNGQERDDEVAGVGNINTAEFWEYDAILGRRWNCDPIDKPWMYSYQAFSNKPRWA
jgi:hypothetical protein